MKKFLILASAVVFFASCNNTSEKKTTEDTTATTDHTMVDPNNTNTTPPATMDSAGMSTLNDMDRNFVSKVSIANNAEAELGRMAASKGNTAGVKDFGNMMAMDHGDAQTKLKAIASSYMLEASDSLDAAHKAIKTKLEGLSGAAFDKEYINAMVKGHKDAVALFEKEISTGGNSRVKDFASSVLPTIQKHLTRIQELQKENK